MVYGKITKYPTTVIALNARANAKNQHRKADLKQLSTALELYADYNGGYPPTPGGGWLGTTAGYGSCGNTTGSGPVTCPDGWIPKLAPTYISVLPTDPNPNIGLGYMYESDGQDFMIRSTNVDNCTSPPGTAGDQFARPNNPTLCEYAVYSPGAKTKGW